METEASGDCPLLSLYCMRSRMFSSVCAFQAWPRMVLLRGGGTFKGRSVAGGSKGLGFAWNSGKPSAPSDQSEQLYVYGP